MNVHVEVRAVGADFDANLLCQLDGAGSLATRHVKLSAGSRAPAGFDFKLKAPTPVRPAGAAEGVTTEAHQVVVKFSAADDRPFQDDLPHDNIRYATFFVRDDSKRQGRKVLLLEDDPNPAAELRTKPGAYWYAALASRLKYYPNEGYSCDLRPAADAAKLRAADLKPYRVICLYQIARPLPDDFLQGAGRVRQRRRRPGDRAAGGAAESRRPQAVERRRWMRTTCCPPRCADLTSAPEGKRVTWDDFPDNHPLTRPFYEWKRGANPDFANEELRPFVQRATGKWSRSKAIRW